MDIGKELQKHKLGSVEAKKIIGRRLLKAGSEMTNQITALERWLTEGDRRLPQDRRTETFTDEDERRETLWIEKHDEMVRLLKMRDMIEKEVLGG